MENVAHELNHTARRCLNQNTVCSTYFGKDRIRYTKRQRKSVYQWIQDLATEISIRAGKSKITTVEWRIAAKQWLLKTSLIKIEKGGKVLPHFSQKLCHN